MDSRIINQFPIRDYLSGSGINPAKENGYYGMYHSPFREDHTASMKVDYSRNLWVDYGTGEGGTLIDLAMRMENCTSGKAMQLLEQQIGGTSPFSFHGEIEYNPETLKKQEPVISIQEIGELTNPSLLTYLGERSIGIEIARLHCKEVHYSVNGKPYFAIGFRNDTGGYELRSKYFKGCSSKDITSIQAGGDTCQLFEGFMDYLSFLTMKGWQQSRADVIVLNSLANLPKVRNALTEYRSVSSFLDNDGAGKKALQELKGFCREVDDQSPYYAKHKDLNEYLCVKGKPRPQQRKYKGMRR